MGSLTSDSSQTLRTTVTRPRALLADALPRLQCLDKKKRTEKLDYMHFNPVKRGLTVDPGDWRWSSDRFYRLDEPGLVRVNEGWAKISFPARTA